ncbi:hypothetical protein [Actinomadura sp. 21ATH]|uniref:hypothetical protein n=1 Tax=Actinomadura sp. 21ATH TaxID=1735444 RepID=UPI0035C15C02
MRHTFGNGRALRRGAVPAAALALVAALPAVAVAAPSAPVPCPDGKGDEAALARAFRAGGTITLEPRCVYAMTRKHGTDSVLPAVTRDTRVEGNKATIVWRGTERVRTMIELAGEPRVRFEMRDVQMRTGRGMSNIRIRPGTSASISNVSGGDSSFWKRFFGVGRDDDDRAGTRPAAGAPAPRTADRPAAGTSREGAPAPTGGVPEAPVRSDPEPGAPAAGAPAPAPPAPEAAPNAPADGAPAAQPKAVQPKDQPQDQQAQQQPYAPQPYAQQPYAQQPYAPQPYAQQPYAPRPYAPQPYAYDPYAYDPYADRDLVNKDGLSDEEERKFAAAFVPALLNGPLANLTDLGGLLGFLGGPQKGRGGR